MYAVVDIKGFQYKLEQGESLRVPAFSEEVGKKISLGDVLLVADGESVSIGTPFVEGAVVEATITDQGKYDKVVVFKKKRRKDYSVKRGHRQDFTEITVDTIKLKAAKKAAKADTAKKAAADEPAETPAAVEKDTTED